MAPASKHLHKLKRHTYKNKEQVYFCANGCGFRVKTNLALGLLSECWRCGKPFSMTEASIRLAKPHCADCTNRENKVDGKGKLVDSILSRGLKVDEKSGEKLKILYSMPTDFREQLQRSLEKVIKKDDADSTASDSSLDDDML